jgi:hypothetical protein
VSNGFDRVRPRTPEPPPTLGGVAPDAVGKRALFSSAVEGERPGIGSVLVECSRCEQQTVLGLAQAMRACWPSLHLALRLGHGSNVTVVGVSGRPFPSFMRCPSCGQGSWVRFTVQL